MMQQMVLQQQTFMQTVTASFQQQQQSMLQQSQTFMQTMETSMQQQLQQMRQQVASSAPVPPTAPGSPVLESYRISTPSPGRSPPPPPPRDVQDAERDVFAKSDKWLPSLPVIDFTSWKDRISEALGFLTWMEKLTSWVGLGSEVFPNELMHAVRTKDEGVLGQDRLTVEQQKRSIRLLHILRQTFAGHDKSSLILQNYVEGAASYQQSGFVALRLLAKEFCLKSRSECLYFRAQLVNQTVKAPTIPEIVRKIESEQHKYSKLLSSLDSDVHAQGLDLQEADLVMVLLRSLPERCRSYCLLHGDSDSFEDLKRVALKYEVQQRVWSEGPGTKLNPFKGDEKGKGGDEKGTPKGKGGKKGKRGRSQSASRGGAKGNKDVECWNCGKKGHYSADCWAPPKKDQGKENAKNDGKPSPKGKAKAKGGKDKGKGKGKTVAEVAPDEGEGVDLAGDQGWTEPESEAHVSSVMRQLNEIVDEVRRDWIPPAQDEFVMTREASVKVRMAELEHRIASDLGEMLGKDLPGSVNLLRGSQVNGVSSLNNDQMANWWLIDSGASVTVIAKKFLDDFTVMSRMPLCPSERYSAANDTPVTVFERVRVKVKMPLYEGDSYIGMVPVMVTGVVADVGHNILSTEHMVATGWEVKFSKAEISLRRVKGGLVGYGQSWAGCPWIYLQGADTSTKKVTFGRTHVKMDVDQEDSSSPMEVGNVSAMTVKMKEELEVHRMRGHIPFMPGCPHCQKTRGVTQHRRGKDVGNRPVELQADFCYINLVTGTFVKDQPNAPNMKILVMTEMSTRMVGCALVGTSADHTSTWIRYWMNAFGLTTAGSAVLLRTDSETAVSALIRRANLGIRVVTQKAPPQGHESVGGVERAVRTLKELFSTIRLDLTAQGYDLKRSPRAFELGLVYCAAMHNHHSAAFDGKKSPQELVLQRPLAECASTLIGMTVLAELPDSMKKTSLSRFVEAAYLYPEVGGLTHVVSSMVNGTPHHYRAKSIKHITPLKVGMEHCGHLLKAYDPSDTLAPPILKELDDGIPSEVEGEVDKAFEGKVSQGPTTDMSQVGPPAAWVREHGGTPGCPACGEKRGKANHNAACKRRYDKWLKDQRERLVVEGEQETVGGEPGSRSGSTAAPKVSSEARSSEDAGVPLVSAPSLKRPKTSHETTGLEGEEPSAASKPDVIDVEMVEDPSIPYENIPDEEMPPGYFEDEQPMEIDKGVAEEAAAMNVESESSPSEPSRVPRLLQSLHPRLDAPEGFTSACEEASAPKLAKVVNAVLIEKNTVYPEQVQMCGSKVWLAKMKSALSELDGCPLDVSSAMEGRRTELGSMDSHKAGRIVSADEAHAFAKKHGIRIIPTRWVLGPKVVNGKEAVRARCVVQDVAKGSTASSLGLSATTPSLEALRTLLAIAAKDSMDIATLDVSTAFLHSPLPKGEKAVIMLPRDVSSRSDYYETGRITPTGGRIVFLGREIERNGEHLRMRVPPKYMESLFETDFCKDLKVVSSPPDLVKIIEKGRADPEKDSVLSEAAAMRYRAVLGRIAWWGQSRPDLARWMSILSQGQSKPTACFEHALRQVIRFLKGQYLCWSYFGPGSEVPDGGSATLDVYADASWAPQESEGLATLIGHLAGSKVEIRICGIRFSRSDSGSSATQASTSVEVVPLLKDDMTDSKADTLKGSVEAPYWCKQCKWLFKTDHSHGLGWTDEYKPRCEKCQGVISVWGSNASHAFHLREGEKEKRFPKGGKGEGKSSQWVQGDGGKGDGTNLGESSMAKATPKPEGPPSVATMFPELNGSEVPAWYTELWGKMGIRGAPLDQVDLQPLVESLPAEDQEWYTKSFEKLSHPNFAVFEHGDPMPGKVVTVLDMRSQYGGKSVIWETTVNGGCIYVDMVPGLSGLAVLMFVQYLKRKGFLVLILLSGHQDPGILRMMDLLYTLPILGVERCTKGDLETTSHPPWVCRWKEHAQNGNVVFKAVLSKVCWMSDLTCQTLKAFDSKVKDLGKPLPLWAYFAYTNNDVVKESLIVECDHMAVKVPNGVLESIREPMIWQCNCAWHMATDYTSRFTTNLPCILWEHIWKFLGGNTQKLMDVELGLEQAVLAAVASHDLEVEAENKRKRRAELDAAEEEAAKKARTEQPAPSSPAPPVLDGAISYDRADRCNGNSESECW
ncbi:unnamed protein product [Symbiodinium sp. CCMP2592]|nr:unnamed protein product [Symbiodinium sp. CCMP2592]